MTSHDFHSLRVAAVRPEADALVVTLDVPPAAAETFRFKPGQHLALRATLAGEDLRRTYSICSAIGEPLRIAIKRVDGGRFSTWAAANLRAGATLDVMPPSGRFTLPEHSGKPRNIVAFAAGSGITPVIAMIRHALATEPKSRITLVYGNRGHDTILFAGELEDLKDRHLDRFEIVHLLTRDDDVEAPLFLGRITPEKVRALGERLIDYKATDHVLLCGPGSMIKDVRNELIARGVPAARIHHEFFSSPGVPRADTAPPKPVETPAALAGKSIDVTLVLDGVRRRIAAKSGQKVLDAALESGVKVPYSCAGGMCSTCRARVVEGTASMAVNYSLEPWETDKGFVLTCQAVPTSEKIVIDYDAM